VLTLYQTEWCRGSQLVRQRLTELGVDFVGRQVAADPEQRSDLLERFGTASVPLLELEDGSAVAGTDEILSWLDAHFAERADAELHRARAARSLARRCADAA
jgi:glutathione S-transferase